jgi:hypothetical protein
VKYNKKKKILIILSVLFILVIPSILIVGGATWLGRSWIRPEVVEEKEAEAVIPSQILADKLKYKDQLLLVRAQVVMDETVCERKTCPQNDPCCGCQLERNLLVVDAGMSVLRSLPGKLLLLTPDKKSLCQRKTNSCDYQCPGWQPGAIYEIRGTFRATPPPRGTALNIYFGYYLEAEESYLVGNLGIFERGMNFFTDLKNIIASWKTSGYYILH